MQNIVEAVTIKKELKIPHQVCMKTLSLRHHTSIMRSYLTVTLQYFWDVWTSFQQLKRLTEICTRKDGWSRSVRQICHTWLKTTGVESHTNKYGCRLFLTTCSTRKSFQSYYDIKRWPVSHPWIQSSFLCDWW